MTSCAGDRHHRGGAEHWAHLDDPARDEWQRPALVMAAAGITGGQVVVDIGAGTGYFGLHLSRAVGVTGKVLALDVNPNLVEHMRRRFHEAGLNNVEVRGLSHDDPGLEPGSVDRVLIVDLWHHLYDRVAYGRKLRAALRPGGRLVVIDRGSDSSHAPPVGMDISVERVMGELDEAGFSTRVLPQILPRQFMVEGAACSATPPA
jgi:ubiquinone/menaquinone biosynthesis C-methylase UbiE